MTKTIKRWTEEQESVVKQPDWYTIKIYDDDETPVDFVMDLLMSQFEISDEGIAFDLTYQIHDTGELLIGSYTLDVADTKCQIVRRIITGAGYPLRIEVVVL